MIQIQSPYKDEQGVIHENLENRYSDLRVKILQVETGVPYDAAVDVIPCRYTYEETDEPIDSVEPTDDEYIQAAKIMLGEVG